MRKMKTANKFMVGAGILLLMSACGTDEEMNTAETSSNTAVEESETVEDVTVEENKNEAQAEGEASQEEESPENIEEVNEGLAEEDMPEGFTQMYGYSEEVFTEKVEALNVTHNLTAIYGMELDPETVWLFQDRGYEVGDELQMVTVEFTVENTVEEGRSFYLDQTQIVTSTGEQIESELMMSQGLQSEMLGAVESTGTINFVLSNNNGEDIEWIDIIIPSVSDDNWNTLTDQYKKRIEIKK